MPCVLPVLSLKMIQLVNLRMENKVIFKKKILFNPDESIEFNGNTGPFIQYTYARIKSILNKSDNISNVNSS